MEEEEKKGRLGEMEKKSEIKERRGKDERRTHAVCLPMPAQGHLNPMMVLATFLHSHGYVITFIHTHFDRSRILHSVGSDALRDTETFRYASFPDGLPPSDITGNRHIPSLCKSLHTRAFEPFLEVLRRIDDEGPRVTLVIWDGITSFGGQAAEQLGIPNVMLWTASATGLLTYLYLPEFVSRGIFPFKDESCLSNEYLKNMKVDWIPGMEGITLKEVPELIRTTDPNDIMFNFVKDEVMNAHKASSIFINTFEDLEFQALSSMASILPCPICPIGPLSLLHDYQPPSPPNLWKYDNNNNDCMQWLKQREANSVVYVNFGSIINLTLETFKEFAWGLVESKQYVLWVIRKDLIAGWLGEWPEELKEVAGEKFFVAEWCPQREVLLSESVGGFVTHCGWNSVLEGIGGGVAMVCWPAFAEQVTNSYYVCEKWGLGVEIGEEVKREEVRRVVVEMMEGEKGKEMRKRAVELKEKACQAVGDGGSSWLNLKNKFLLP
ncbi:putative 7-deoxyloganetin glucosyltransferase [Dioscorea sansibarensis]